MDAPFTSSTLFNTPSVKEDSGMEALKLFSSKLLVHDIQTFIQPDGGGAGGLVTCDIFLAKELSSLYFVLALTLDMPNESMEDCVSGFLIPCVIHRTGMPRERIFLGLVPTKLLQSAK